MRPSSPTWRAAFEALLAGHSFPVVEGKVSKVEIDARLTVPPRPRPDTVMVQVDFAVRHPEPATSWLVESFAGVGSTWQNSIGQGIAKFERSVLHPLIAGLLDRTACPTQVEWETWRHPSGDFDVCLGPQLVLYSDADVPQLGAVLTASATP